MENDMKKIEITEKNVKAAFKAAKSDEVKEVLAELFYTPENKLENKPNLDDYTTIKSYEDACEALEEEPILNYAVGICGYEDDGERINHPEIMDMPQHINALLKLETISRALWGKNFNPTPDAEGANWYYYPEFDLYTKKEIVNMPKKDKNAILSASVYNDTTVGYGCLYIHERSSRVNTDFGYRLCQETVEKALYFEQQFIELWAEYLAFNFITGERIKIEL